VPGRRKQTLELARELERRGFAGIYCPSFGDGLGLCEALALSTSSIPFGTSIANLYTRHVADYAQTAALVHELSGGRFRFGIGVSHQPVHQRMGLHAGKPLADVRRFVADLRAVPRVGELPPIVLAAMRRHMVALGGEIAQGIVFANAARSHMPASLSHLPERAQGSPDFFIGDMIPTVIDSDRAAAAAVNRRTLVGYVSLPNYRNYWKEAGYVEEMEAIEKALGRGEADRLPERMSERWLRDVTLFGSRSEVREGLEAWLEAGVRTPILVPSSTRGGQFQAFEELIDLFA
jgi:alkanesulfonate monooxygenase SsuD/methylene tetrahydromethanopterin reductase-like flavin-dependent oxidoreductase (luciferase family)